MDNNGIEKKLAENGFTSKEIKFIRQWSDRDSESVTDILKQIRRVFVGMLFIRILILLICVAVFLLSTLTDFYFFFAASFIAILIIEVFAPITIGAKVYRYCKSGK